MALRDSSPIVQPGRQHLLLGTNAYGSDMLRTEPKMKVCEGCGSMFLPRASFARACRMVCARKVVAKDKKEKAAKEKADFQERKDKNKPLSYFEALAEKEVNKYVRLRDRNCG